MYKETIGVIGLGYVGLPLAMEFAHHHNVLGYDIIDKRIDELNQNIDSTDEIDSALIAGVRSNLTFTANIRDLTHCNIYIITVPTPITENNTPDLEFIKAATESVGPLLNNGDVVIYESTVAPGTTEEICIPILEKSSQLTLGRQFYVGYSPERVSPGRNGKKLTEIIKLTSGSCSKSRQVVDELYSRIITAGTFPVKSIKAAEAAKLMENIQRDVNIALMNEFSVIFDRLGVSVHDVIDAASTKWNFNSYRPGLVGGHCIGVDPYYLIDHSHAAGVHPELITCARKINEAMPDFYARKIINAAENFILHDDPITCLLVGFAFKPNCADIRNTKVASLANLLINAKINVEIYDPKVDSNDCMKEHQLTIQTTHPQKTYDVICICVPHEEFKTPRLLNCKSMMKRNSLIFDLQTMSVKTINETYHINQ